MRPAGISLEDVPPLGVPVRFFVVAPPLGTVAAIVLLAGGSEAWSSRWTPSALAATHLLTLGFMAMIMTGALFQLVPVLSGRGVPGAERLAAWVCGALAAGALGLAAALLGYATWLFWLAAALLVAAFSCFLAPLGWRLCQRIGGDPSMASIRLAALALLVTVALGAYLSVGRADPELGMPFRLWTDTHAGWGLFGFVALLVMGVSYQVIPMFHVAPAYPRAVTTVAAPTVFVALVAVSHARSVAFAAPLLALAGAGVAAWAAATVRVLRRRRRRRADAMIGFWYVAIASACGAVVLALVCSFAPAALPVRGPIAVGVLAIIGFAMSAIVGMQQKIVPFLVFLHLQRRCLPDLARARHLPTMSAIWTEHRAAWQLRLHVVALVSSLAAALAPRFGPVAAFALGADMVWLSVSQWIALARYRAASRAIAAV